MGLFDHLFKPKPGPAGEEIVEAEAASPEPLAAVESGSQNAASSRPDPSAFLHPKNFIPRAGSPIVPAPKSPLATATRFAERKLGPSVAPAASDEIVLTLGDILSRIPTHYLKSGTHDPKRELRFKINDLSSDIARGRAAVPLSSVARLLPDIFVKEIAPDEDTEVRLPLQKLVEQIGLLRSRPAAPAAEKTAQPAPQPPSAQRVSPEVETPTLTAEIVPPVVKPAGLAPARESLRELRPDAEKVDELRRLGESLRESFFAADKVVEAEPVAEKPVIERVPQIESPTSALMPEPAKEAEAPAVKGADFFSPPPVESTTVAPKPAQAEVLASSFAQALAVESEKKAVMAIEKIEALANEAEQRLSPTPVPGAGSAETPASIAPPSARPEVELTKEPKPAVEPHADAGSRTEPESAEERIHLSLAAILRQCPQEIIVGQLPPVDDSVRITLPFAPIDRQLNTGKVEVSATHFVAALPARFQKFFKAPPDLKIPIPLEEVFQNLPTASAEIAIPPEQPLGLILAPAAESVAQAPVPTNIPEAVVEPVPAITQETPAMPPEPDPTPAAVLDFSHSASVEKPAAEALPSLPDSVPSVSEPAVEIPSSVSEIGSEAAAADEVKPALHLPAFHIFAPPPPLVTLAKSEVSVAETTAFADPPATVVSEAPIEAAPLAEATKLELRTAEISAPLESVATEVPPPPAKPESATLVLIASAKHESQTGEAPLPIMETVVPAPSPETELDAHAPVPELQKEMVATAELSSAPASPAAGSVENPPETLASKWEAVAQTAHSDTSGVFAAATKTIVPPLMIRPLIMPPPPLFGFKPMSEAPAEETPAEDHYVTLDKISVITDFKLVSYDDTEKTKVISDELLAAPIPVSQPDPAQPELFNEPLPSVETAALVGASPDTEAPSAFGETAAKITGEIPSPTFAVEADATPLPIPTDSPQPIAVDDSLPEANEQVVEVVPPSETAPRSSISAVEADLHSVEAVLFGGAAAPEVATRTIAEKEIESAAAPPPPPDFATTHFAETEIKPAAAPVAEVIPPLEEDSIRVQTFEPSKEEAKSPEPEPAPEVEKAAPIEEFPAVDADQIAAAVPVIPPPPLPLLPLPRLGPSFAASDVIPPPALQLRRLDQDALQALFMTEETLDLPKISRLAATLPGVHACVIATRDQAVTGGSLPEGFDLAALLGLAPRIREAASRMPIGALKHFTIYGESYSISFFERRGLSLCAIHRARSFVPGVREKLVAIADELSQT